MLEKLFLVGWLFYFALRVLHNAYLSRRTINAVSAFKALAKSAAHPFIIIAGIRFSADIGFSDPPVFLFQAAGFALFCSGIALIVAAHIALQENYRPAVIARRPCRLVTGGPFRFVRHPIYAGSIAIAIGLETAYPSAFFVAVIFVTPIILWQISREERKLRLSFGSRWVAFTQKTPYRLLPGIY